MGNREVGLVYDSNGNQLSDASGFQSLKYDIENRLIWGQRGVSSNGNGYGYDPDNRRVYVSTWTYSQVNGWSTLSEQITYWGVGGQKMSTYALTADLSGLYLAATGYNVYFGSKLVRKVDANGTTTMVQPDRLGSFGKFAPYGEERGTTANNTEKFATYFRDGDTGLDYAINRYFNSTSGRFLSADPYNSSNGPGDPASWNSYSYVGGDPVNRFDPAGLYWVFVTSGFCWAGVGEKAELVPCDLYRFEKTRTVIREDYLQEEWDVSVRGTHLEPHGA